jgi:hypothetical protein
MPFREAFQLLDKVQRRDSNGLSKTIEVTEGKGTEVGWMYIVLPYTMTTSEAAAALPPKRLYYNRVKWLMVMHYREEETAIGLAWRCGTAGDIQTGLKDLSNLGRLSQVLLPAVIGTNALRSVGIY